MGGRARVGQARAAGALAFGLHLSGRALDDGRPAPRLQCMNTAARQRSPRLPTRDAERAPQYVAVQARGTIALPAGLRRRLHLDEPGAQLAIVERDDGVIEMRPVLPVPADQRWFWTDRWQAMEHEVDGHVDAGRVVELDGPDELFAHLDSAAGVVPPDDEPAAPAASDSPGTR